MGDEAEVVQFPFKCRYRTGSVPCDREEWGGGSAKRTSERITSAFIRLAQGVVDAIWLDLGALNRAM